MTETFHLLPSFCFVIPSGARNPLFAGGDREQILDSHG